jgi:hypothetical protein
VVIGIVAGLVDEIGIVEMIYQQLGMMMALCLLVYNLGQRQLRQALAQHDETIPNQLGKPTSSPTLRWVFQCFIAKTSPPLPSVPPQVQPQANMTSSPPSSTNSDTSTALSAVTQPSIPTRI